MRVRASDVVRATGSPLNELKKLRYDTDITALASNIDAKLVVHVRASVETENDVVHLFVRKLDHIVIDENAVRRQRKPEVLACFFFDRASISDNVFDHLPVEERFAAEKIDFQISP